MNINSAGLRSLAALFAFGASLHAAPVAAATIAVDNAGCTLVEAIQNANSDTNGGGNGCAAGSGSDTITLPANSTITLATPDPIEPSNGLPVVTSTLTIQGNGATIVRDPFAPQFRLLTVNAGVTLTLNNLTLRGGRAPDGDLFLSSPGLNGGAILDSGILTVTHCTLTDNRAGNGVTSGNSGNKSGSGGAIYVAGSGSRLTISNSTLSYNHAGGSGASGPPSGSGGAIYVNGSGSPGSGGLTLSNSTLSFNQAGAGHDQVLIAPTDGGSGGAIYFAGIGFMSVSNNSFISNRAGDGGAGNNSSPARGGSGGAIFRDASSVLQLYNNVLVSNQAGAGGSAIDIGAEDGGSGGALYFAGSGALYLTNNTLSSNQAGKGGFGDSQFGLGTGGDGGSGGAIYLTGSARLDMKNNTLSSNQAGDGGDCSGSSTFPQCVQGAPGAGGGLSDAGSSARATLSRNLIAGNIAVNGREVNVVPGTFTAGNYNLFGFNNSSGVNGSVPGASDIVPAAGVTVASILSPLADNGGPTQTQALPPGSPAIDVARGCPSTDQRGVNRPKGPACELGAFEVGANSVDLEIVKTASAPSVLNGAPLTYTLTVTNRGPENASAVQLVDPLPAEVNYVSASPVTPATGDCVYDAGLRTVTCLLGNLARLRSTAVRIVTTASGVGVATNTGSTSSDPIDTDPTGNNASTVAVSIIAVDTTPDKFRFLDVSNAPLNSLQTSNTVTISGINVSAPISITGGLYSIDCNAAGFTSAPGTIAPGASVCVRHTSAATGGKATRTELLIGGVQDTFTSTTRIVDPTPDPFSFVDVNDAPLDTKIVSNTISFSGVTAPASISVRGGQYSIRCDPGGFTKNSGTIQPGQTVCVRNKSANRYSTASSTTLNVGGASDTFTTTTIAAPVP